MTYRRKIAFLFPGQGSQYPGMGKDFYESFPLVRETFEEADDLLKRHLSKIILEGPAEELTRTRNSQIGIFTVSVAILRVLQKQFPEIVPAFCAGLSLGEYTALHAASFLSFEETFALVEKRGEYMNEACEETKGTMAVVLGLDAEAASALVAEVDLPRDLWVANFNCPGQVVISGTEKGIAAGTAAALAKGAKRVLPLQVHGAFHSGLMKQAEERLSPHVMHASLHKGTAGLVMNVPGTIVGELDAIRTNLVRQVTHSVLWEQGIRWMLSQGVELFVEIGCGKTLAGFNKRIAGAIPTISIENVKDLVQFEKGKEL